MFTNYLFAHINFAFQYLDICHFERDSPTWEEDVIPVVLWRLFSAANAQVNRPSQFRLGGVGRSALKMVFDVPPAFLPSVPGTLRHAELRIHRGTDAQTVA